VRAPQRHRRLVLALVHPCHLELEWRH
jgi:hypothetical protein